ncbi:MAG: HAD hydrolase-like protein [Rickettsiales bacterium]|jgi:HAD superfamily hydrolase (TIGR01450 family)|nr:HAD hydrolase-like protein [Rickettsiales bacterium]
MGTARTEASIHQNLSEILEDVDVVILDAYGVFWNGKSFNSNSRELMRSMMQNPRLTVYVLSNATQLSSESIENYRKKEGGGIVPNVHYHRLITSGDFVRSILLEGKLAFKTNANPKYVYQMGIPNRALFEGTKYTEVDSVEKADFVYLSVPKLNEEQYRAYSRKEHLKESTSNSHGNPNRTWNSLVIDPFMADLKKIKKLGLPMLSANPDLTAEEAVKNSSDKSFVVRQGMIAQAYKKLGGEVKEYGKPDKDIYDIVFEDLKRRGRETAMDRIVMVGDTIRTDIIGANRANIKSCLCTDTGVTANEIDKQLKKKVDKLNKKQMTQADRKKRITELRVRAAEKLLKRENAKADYLIKGLSVGYRGHKQ